MQDKIIKIVSRSSNLAKWQTNYMVDRLLSIGIKSEVEFFSFDTPEFGSNDFTSFIDSLVSSRKADVSVHSLKDVSVISNYDLCIAALSERNDPSDILIIRKDAVDIDLPLKIKKGGIIGTSSLRRRIQLNHIRNDLIVNDLRGNVDDRIEELRSSSQYDGIIIAKAGVDRLGLDLSEFFTLRLHPREFIPAPGQGIIACMVRSEDIYLRRLLSRIHQNDVALCSNVERQIFKELGGICKSTIGVFCERDLRGSYHCYLSIGYQQQLLKVNYSQSTTFGLSDKIIELYHQKIKEHF